MVVLGNDRKRTQGLIEIGRGLFGGISSTPDKLQSLEFAESAKSRQK